MSVVITGQRLSDGRVVFATAAGEWSEDVHAAALHEAPDEALARARADQAANLVVDVHPVPARRVGPRVEPERRRERLRAIGPSVRPDLQRAGGWED